MKTSLNHQPMNNDSSPTACETKGSLIKQQHFSTILKNAMAKCDLGDGPIIVRHGMLLLIQQNSIYPDAGYLDRQSTGWVWPFGQICREFYKTNLPLPVIGSSTVQCYGF